MRKRHVLAVVAKSHFALLFRSKMGFQNIYLHEEDFLKRARGTYGVFRKQFVTSFQNATSAAVAQHLHVNTQKVCGIILHIAGKLK